MDTIEDITKTTRYLRAADTMLPELLKIPRIIIKKHHLLFRDIIIHTLAMQDELPGTPLLEIYEVDFPFYIAYGKSKSDYEAEIKP